jgi:isopenicillin-N epimerase
VSTRPLTEQPNPLWGEDWPQVRELWPLESTVVHLNHGAFGAVPTVVLQEQQSWRARMESNPVRFFLWELSQALGQARAEVARFFATDSDSIAFVRNATTAVSTVLATRRLQPGDEILLTDHAYGAVLIAARRWAALSGARVVIAPVPLQGGDDEVSEAVLGCVNGRTKLAIIDQVSSPTARRMPLVSLVPALQERGVLVMVDGAHAAGMLAVEPDRLGTDFWTGNLHKWCCAPRGTAVLHVAAPHRASVRPLVASWAEPDGFPEAFSVVGSDDLTAWLAAPRSLRLLDQLDLARLRRHNVELAVLGQHTVAEALGLERSALPRDPAVSMQLVPLPAGLATDPAAAAALQARIGEQAAVEVGVTTWNGQGFVRVSAQAYNAPSDYERLAAHLPSLL